MITIDQASEMGAKGAEPTETERLLFEAWMRGHCWLVQGDWDGKSYVHESENTGYLHPGAMLTRQLWAAWRDRAALAEQPAHPQQEPLQNIPSLTTVLAYLERLVPSEVYTGMIDIIEDEFQRKQQPAQQEPVKVKTCDTCQFGERCNQWSCKNHSLWKPVQPAQRKPLTRAQVKEMMVENGYDQASPQERADFINGLRHGEDAHNIKEKNT